MRPSLRARAAIAAALPLAILAGGCAKESGGPPMLDRFDLALEGSLSANHAPIYAGLDAGHFEQAGFELNLREPAEDEAATALDRLAAGRVDLAITSPPEVIAARQEGDDLLSVATLIHGPLSSLISLPRGRIAGVPDLGGRRVAIMGGAQRAVLLEGILREAGLDPERVETVEGAPDPLGLLARGRVDAVFGASETIDAVALELRGRNPVVLRADELGLPAYDELVLVARGAQVRDDPGRLRALLGALERGATLALEEPREAVRALRAASGGELDAELAGATVGRTLRRLRSPEGRPYGWQDPVAWGELVAFMANRGLIGGRPQVEELLTNELLPRPIR